MRGVSYEYDLPQVPVDSRPSLLLCQLHTSVLHLQWCRICTCGSEQIAAVLNRRLTTWSQQSNPTFDTNMHRFPDFCLQNFWCLATYDAVWAMALALNNSAEQLKAKGLSLTGNAYGDVSVTEVIKQQMFKLKFQGMTGEIEFNETTGFIITRESSIFQFFEESQSDKEIASYTFGNDTIKVNYTTAHFVSTNFNELYIHVSLPLAAVIILLNVAASVIIMVIHLLNTLYSHTKSIKAMSRNCGHQCITRLRIVIKKF